jgi:hypothetical protein
MFQMISIGLTTHLRVMPLGAGTMKAVQLTGLIQHQAFTFHHQARVSIQRVFTRMVQI